MKLSLGWLRDFVDLPTSDPQEVREALESLGHEVEGMRVVEPSFTGVVIGRVVEVAAHPDADKVRVCQVDVGDSVAEIVCGAWNFAEGAIVPVALPGAVLGGDFVIGRRTIRGVVSNGMICSEAELGLGDDAEGIMVLDQSYPAAAARIGKDLTSLLTLPDAHFDVAITPNRPDCMSVIGLARELAGFYEIPLREPQVSVTEHEPTSAVSITILDPDACPRFAGREVRGVIVGPSPHWMRARLEAAGIRPINNVVDASNYAMIELGHPTHAFDLDRLGDVVGVRRAAAGERIVTLDGQERVLEAADIVVADAERPVAIAGVMGGADTEVREGTERILVEAAYWDPPSILLTSKRLGLRSEASARFERGMDPNFCAVAADRVAQLLEQTSGAEPVAGIRDAYPHVIEPRRINLSLGEIRRHLGIDIPAAEVSGILDRLGFTVSGGDPLTVVVPTRRPDVSRPIDLVEEIARLHGFDRVPDHVATGPGGGLPAAERNLRRLRALLAGAGYHETLNFSFIGASHLDALDLPQGDPRRSGIAVVNPLHDEQGVMRTTLLPGLLDAAARNVAQRLPDVALFETGSVFLPGAGKLPEQPEHLAFVAVGGRGSDWESGGREVDVRDATGLWELIAHRMNLPEPSVKATGVPAFHPGRSAEVRLAGTPVGVVGEIHPDVAAAFGLAGRVVAGEIELAPLVAERPPWQLEPASVYPPVIFDMAFEADIAVPAAELVAAVREGSGDLLEDVRVFDVFSGPPVAAGRRSIAVRLAMRAADRTLTDGEVAPVRRRIVEAVAAATGATLRGEV